MEAKEGCPLELLPRPDSPVHNGKLTNGNSQRFGLQLTQAPIEFERFISARPDRDRPIWVGIEGAPARFVSCSGGGSGNPPPESRAGEGGMQTEWSEEEEDSCLLHKN